jgi:hypothetical protein
MASETTLSKVGHWMGYQNLLSKVPLCFRRHVEPLLLGPTPFPMRVEVRQFRMTIIFLQPVVKNNSRIFIYGINLLCRPHLDKG